MALFALGNNGNPIAGPEEELANIINSANDEAENVATAPPEVHFENVQPKHQKIYLDSYKIRQQLGRVLKQVSQGAQQAKDEGDAECQAKLERMEYLALTLYKYFVEVNNAFRLDPEQQAPRLKKLIDDVYSNKILKENIEIVIPPGYELPEPNRGRPRNNSSGNKRPNRSGNQRNSSSGNQRPNRSGNRGANTSGNQRPNRSANQRNSSGNQRNTSGNQRNNSGNQRNNSGNRGANNSGNQRNSSGNQRNTSGNRGANNQGNNKKNQGEMSITETLESLVF